MPQPNPHLVILRLESPRSARLNFVAPEHGPLLTPLKSICKRFLLWEKTKYKLEICADTGIDGGEANPLADVQMLLSLRYLMAWVLANVLSRKGCAR